MMGISTATTGEWKMEKSGMNRAVMTAIGALFAIGVLVVILFIVFLIVAQ